MELHLILLSEFPMHGSELSREFLVGVTDVAGRFLDAKIKVRVFCALRSVAQRIRTIWGRYGGGIRLFTTSSQLTSLKKGCDLISSASPIPEPNRRVGSLVSSWVASHYNVRGV